jgi:hypothetical protein
LVALEAMLQETKEVFGVRLTGAGFGELALLWLLRVRLKRPRKM